MYVCILVTFLLGFHVFMHARNTKIFFSPDCHVESGQPGLHQHWYAAGVIAQHRPKCEHDVASRSFQVAQLSMSLQAFVLLHQGLRAKDPSLPDNRGPHKPVVGYIETCSG